MKTQVGKLSQLALRSVSLAGRGVSVATQAASSLTGTANAAGKTAQKALDAAMDHQTTKAAVFKAKEMAATAKVEAGEFATSAAGRALDLAKSTATGAKTVSDRVVATAKKLMKTIRKLPPRPTRFPWVWVSLQAWPLPAQN